MHHLAQYPCCFKHIYFSTIGRSYKNYYTPLVHYCITAVNWKWWYSILSNGNGVTAHVVVSTINNASIENSSNGNLSYLLCNCSCLLIQHKIVMELVRHHIGKGRRPPPWETKKCLIKYDRTHNLFSWTRWRDCLVMCMDRAWLCVSLDWYRPFYLYPHPPGLLHSKWDHPISKGLDIGQLDIGKHIRAPACLVFD